MELASGFLAASRDELAEMGRDDPQRLFDAAQLLQDRVKSGSQSMHSGEHLAFSLVHAAYELLRHQMNDQKP